MKINMIQGLLLGGILMLGAPAWAADEHELHHPAGETEAPNVSTEQPSSQMQMGSPKSQTSADGMMGGMMRGMMGRCPVMSMMADHIEGRIAFLKAELKITESQLPQWEAFAQAVRTNMKTMMAGRQLMMETKTKQEALPARIEESVNALSARLEALKKVEAALDPLYASLSDEQKRVADELVISPMGMIGMM